MNAPEIKEIPKIEEINNYLDEVMASVHEEIFAYPGEHRADWTPLNELFLETVLTTS